MAKGGGGGDAVLLGKAVVTVVLWAAGNRENRGRSGVEIWEFCQRADDLAGSDGKKMPSYQA